MFSRGGPGLRRRGPARRGLWGDQGGGLLGLPAVGWDESARDLWHCGRGFRGLVSFALWGGNHDVVMLMGELGKLLYLDDSNDECLASTSICRCFPPWETTWGLFKAYCFQS